MENYKCERCGTDKFFLRSKEATNGITHVGAYCAECNTWRQWLPARKEESDLTHVGEIEIPFGKHKGTKLKDLPRDYVQWASENLKAKDWTVKMAAVLKSKQTDSNEMGV